MIRPDHAWVFFTIVLSLALAMSIPPQKLKMQTDFAYDQISSEH
jgi:hypothetical protein